MHKSIVKNAKLESKLSRSQNIYPNNIEAKNYFKLWMLLDSGIEGPLESVLPLLSLFTFYSKYVSLDKNVLVISLKVNVSEFVDLERQFKNKSEMNLNIIFFYIFTANKK